MVAERQDSTRELRLEGAGLFAVGGVLLVALAGAFFLGRWVERRKQAALPATAAHGPGPLSQVVEPGAFDDTTQGVTVFDRSQGPGQQAEPGREARARPTAPSTAPAEAEPPRPTPPPDDPVTGKTAADATPSAPDGFYVQVFASRDRDAADKLVQRLQNEGYEVRLFSDVAGRGALMRVRVGGFPSEQKARTIAADLRKSGYADAFVTRVE